MFFRTVFGGRTVSPTVAAPVWELISTGTLMLPGGVSVLLYLYMPGRTGSNRVTHIKRTIRLNPILSECVTKLLQGIAVIDKNPFRLHGFMLYNKTFSQLGC